MSTVAPGWYKDPAEPSTQRYWDGEGWLGDPLPADAEPPAGPPPQQPAPLTQAPAATPGSTAPGTSPGQGTSGAAGTSAAPGASPGRGTRAAPPSAGLPAPPGWPPGHPYPPQRSGPPPQPFGFTLAGIGARFMARLVDFFAVLLLCAVANAWFAYQWWQAFEPYLRDALHYQVNGGTMPDAPAAVSNLFVMMCVVATAVWFAYEVPGSANSGQTMGKRLLGIRVIRLDSGERLGFGRAFRRWGRLGLPTLLWPCLGIGFLLQAFDCLFALFDRPLHQALHDKAALTVVVRAGRSSGTDKANLSDATRGGRHADPR